MLHGCQSHGAWLYCQSDGHDSKASTPKEDAWPRRALRQDTEDPGPVPPHTDLIPNILPHHLFPVADLGVGKDCHLSP